MEQQPAGKHLVIAFFASPAAGEVAARALGKQESARGRGGSVGLLTLDKRGKVAAAKLGSNRTGQGDAADSARTDNVVIRAVGGHHG